VFALLLLLNIGLDFWKYRSGRGLRLRLALRATLRENLFDVALFCMALLASLTLHYGQVVVIVSGLLRYQESLVRGLLLICAKSHLLFRTIERFEKGCMTQKLNGASIVKPWSVPEMLALSCVTLSLMLPLGFSFTVVYFVIIYSIIAPFWMLKAIYNAILSKEASWTFERRA
jgi:hypothetical protein